MTLTAIQALESALYALNAIKNTPLNKHTEPNGLEDTYRVAMEIQTTLRQLKMKEHLNVVHTTEKKNASNPD